MSDTKTSCCLLYGNLLLTTGISTLRLPWSETKDGGCKENK